MSSADKACCLDPQACVCKFAQNAGGVFNAAIVGGRINIFPAKSDIAQHVIVEIAQVRHLPSTIGKRPATHDRRNCSCASMKVGALVAGKCVVVILLVAVMSALLLYSGARGSLSSGSFAFAAPFPLG